MSFEKIIIWVLSLVYTKQYINKVSRNLILKNVANMGSSAKNVSGKSGKLYNDNV